MANELRILASLAVDLGTSDPQPIDMSAYGTYVALGYAVNELAEAIPGQNTKISLLNASNEVLVSPTVNALTPVGAGGLAVITAGTQAAKIQAGGGNLHVVVSQTLRPGNSAKLHVIGLELS